MIVQFRLGLLLGVTGVTAIRYLLISPETSFRVGFVCVSTTI